MNDKNSWLDETGAATAEYAIATMVAVRACIRFSELYAQKVQFSCQEAGN